MSCPGFFGKLPSRGDFVSRRLPKDFVDRWDAWLQGGLAASRAALGRDWLEVYLTSPIWRFALAPGVCGEQGQVGVMMPSVDKVGRYFPLTAAVACGRDRTPLDLAFDLAGWYAELEDLLLATLAEAPLELESFDERLMQLASRIEREGANRSEPSSTTGTMRAAGYRRFPALAGAPLRETVRRIAADLNEYPPRWRSVWWTDGSERVEPSVLVAPGLPPPEAFAALLDGRWEAHGWIAPPEAFVLAGRAAALTDPGKARTRNEDSFAYREDLGVFVVADGLGGHQAGEIASRMVTSVVDQLERAADLGERVDRFVQALGVVNGCLQVLAERQAGVELAASTVAALLLDSGKAACVWVGDSRVYRLRDGELRQLSRDHSEAEEGVTDSHVPDNPVPDSHVVTRAVGAPDPLEADVERVDARAGDRFLLCTDGLYGEVDSDEIAAALSLPAPEQACASLKAAVLRGDAPDNLTGIAVYLDRAGEREAGRP